jgi:hypothetical protein
MLRVSRGLLRAVCVTAFGALAVYSFRPPPNARAADAPPDSPGVTVYDPNPNHLWNRLHAALYVGFDGDSQPDPGQLDPFGWQRSPFEDKGVRYKRAVAVLDEFIAEQGHKLITEPRKRSLLQRDLWALFDVTAPSRWLFTSKMMDGDIELASRAAKILRQLALTAEQIKALPDNFAEAAAANKIAAQSGVGQLWDTNGPWILLGSRERAPLALSHVEFFNGRSAFFVFMNCPGGRDQTRNYIASLPSNGSAASIPSLPKGTRVALVRQMQLIDDRGRIVLTPVTETLQIRGEENLEFKLSRKQFAAEKASLDAVGPEDRERSFLTFLGRNKGDGRAKVMRTCFECHQGGIESVNSYTRHFPPSQSIRPKLMETTRDEESLRIRIWKKERYEWGLLQGLTLRFNSP